MTSKHQIGHNRQSTVEFLWMRPLPYTVNHLHTGQVGDGSSAPYTVEPLYKGQVGDGSSAPYTVEPLYKGQAGNIMGTVYFYTIETEGGTGSQ